MSKFITVTAEDILHQTKLACEIPECVEKIISRQVVTEAAAAAGITADTTELQQVADQFRLFNKLDNADETWEWMKKNNLSLSDFEEMVYLSVLSGKLSQHLFAKQIEPYFHEHQLDYTGIVMYEVVLDDEDVAMELFYAIQAGEMSFYDVAHQYIQDAELRRRGGYQGVLHRQNMKPEISATVFAATPPELLKPITTAQGVHLVFVEEIVKPQLTKEIAVKISTELFSNWLKQQTKQIEVELAI